MNVDALDVARAVNHWTPQGVSIELTIADRIGLCEQLGAHLVAELGLAGELAESFVSLASSPYVAEVVKTDPGEQVTS